MQTNRTWTEDIDPISIEEVERALKRDEEWEISSSWKGPYQLIKLGPRELPDNLAGIITTFIKRGINILKTNVF